MRRSNLPEWSGRAALPILVPLVVAAGLVAVGMPALRVVALDYRALLESLRGVTGMISDGGPEHSVRLVFDPQGEVEPLPVLTDAPEYTSVDAQPPILSDGWIDAAETALSYGAFPLAVLLLVGLGLGIRARRAEDARCLGDLPTALKAVLATVTFLPFVAFAVPLTLGLCLWLAVEASAWMQWRWTGPDFSLAELTVWNVGPLLLVSTVLGGALLLRRALRRRDFPRRPVGRLRRWGTRLASVALLLALLPLWLGVLLHAYRVAPVLASVGAFESRCSSCHPATAALSYVRTPDDWRSSLESTCFGLADLEQAEQDEIVSFVTGMRSFSDTWVFRTRCQRCHVSASMYAWDDRHPEDWEMIIDRVARYSPFYYNSSIQKQIARHLSDAYRDDSGGAPDARTSQSLRILRACTSCHFFSRNAEAYEDVSDAAAVALVRRMNERMTTPVSESDVQEAARLWRNAVRDGEALGTLVPHDRPVLEGGLPW